MSNDTIHSGLPRRSMIKFSGMALMAIWSGKTIPLSASAQTGKDLYLAPEDSGDVAVHSRAENLFWSDIMMEHAAIFAMLMPGPELAAQRAQAENFQRSFQTQYDRAKSASLDRNTYAAFNRSTVELIKPFVEFKHRMLEAQNSGMARTLVFSRFFDETIREGNRGIARLEKLATGDVTLTYSEVVDFWTGVMGDHGDFIAHFLDPDEQDLIGQALDSSAVFKGFNERNHARGVAGGEVVLATEELIDFQATVEQGVQNGRVKSIMHPLLAGHMRRETLKFVDELKRTGNRT